MPTALSAATVPSPSLPAAKMDDRKRALAPDPPDDLLAPSRKRLLKDENGQAMRMDAEKEKDIEVNFPLSAVSTASMHVLHVMDGC